MRLRKRDLRARVKGSWRIGFSNERISAYGGLELFRRFLVGLEIPRRRRETLSVPGLQGDYGATPRTLIRSGLQRSIGAHLRGLSAAC